MARSSAPTSAEVARRIEYLRLLPIETIEDKRSSSAFAAAYGLFGRPSSAEITTFTRDLALLLKAGARLDDALELLAGDADVGRLRPVVGKLRASLLSGESLADALADHPALFPPMYAALVRVGEVSGTLDQVLEMLGAERARSEQMRRKLTDAMQYPAFVLVAAGGVMLFFILFVLPQFSSGVAGFRQQIGYGARHLHHAVGLPARQCQCRAADGCGGHRGRLVAAAAARRRGAAIVGWLSRMPGIGTVFQFYRSSLFCRNLGVLLGSGVNLTATLRILVDIMAVTGNEQGWSAAADRVRHGGKLSDALAVREQPAADGGAHAAARRGDRAIAGAGRPRRRIL